MGLPNTPPSTNNPKPGSGGTSQQQKTGSDKVQEQVQRRVEEVRRKS
jgi:hypothetical protein